MQIYCDIANYKLNLKHCAFHPLKWFCKSFEERGNKKYFFHNYFKINQISGSDEYTNMFHRK